MEKETYYPALTELKAAFPGRPMITRKEAARYLHVDPRSLEGDRTFPNKQIGGRNYVTLVSFARWLA